MFLLTVAMAQSPIQNSAQLNSTADIANPFDFLNNRNTLTRRLSKAARPVKPIHASSAMNATDLKMILTRPSPSLEIWPSSSSTVIQ